MSGRTLGPGWSPFVASSRAGDSTAAEVARSGSLVVGYFALPAVEQAKAFERTPPLSAVTALGASNPTAYTYAAQEGFNSQALVVASTVYTFKGGVAIFLQRGTTAVVGVYFGPGPANGTPYDLSSIGLSAAVENAAQTLTAKPSTAPSAPGGFVAIEGKSLPGLPSSNWPSVQSIGGVPPAALKAASVSSNDLAYQVSFYDFATEAGASAFYAAPPGGMPSFLAGALGYTPLDGPTGVPADSRGVDLRSCGGSANLLPDGQCSGGSGSYSAGVATLVRVGTVVVMVGYLSASLPAKADPSTLANNTKIALSALQLLKEAGIPRPSSTVAPTTTTAPAHHQVTTTTTDQLAVQFRTFCTSVGRVNKDMITLEYGVVSDSASTVNGNLAVLGADSTTLANSSLAMGVGNTYTLQVEAFAKALTTDGDAISANPPSDTAGVVSDFTTANSDIWDLYDLCANPTGGLPPLGQLPF